MKYSQTIVCVAVSAFIWIASTNAQVSESQINDAIDDLVTIIEIDDGYGSRLLALPKESIPVLIARLSRQISLAEETGLMGILAYKLKQFDSSTSISQKQQAVDLLVSKCENAEGTTLQMKLYCIEIVPDPKVDELAKRLLSSNNPKTRQYAKHFLQKRATH